MKSNLKLFAFLSLFGATLFSCQPKSTLSSQLQADSIKVKTTYFVDNDSTKPYAEVKIKLDFFKSKTLNDSIVSYLNDVIIKASLGKKFVGQSFNSAAEGFIKDYINTYKKDAESGYKFFLEKEEDVNIPSWCYVKEIDGVSQSLLNDLSVYRTYSYEYTGGAHGMHETHFFNVDLKNKTTLHLKDLFVEGYQEHLKEHIANQLMKDKNAKSIAELQEMGYASNDGIPLVENFYLDETGITFFYNVYDVAAYSMGTTEVRLAYTSLTDVLKKNTIIDRLNAPKK